MHSVQEEHRSEFSKVLQSLGGNKFNINNAPILETVMTWYMIDTNIKPREEKHLVANSAQESDVTLNGEHIFI